MGTRLGSTVPLAEINQSFVGLEQHRLIDLDAMHVVDPGLDLESPESGGDARQRPFTGESANRHASWNAG